MHYAHENFKGFVELKFSDAKCKRLGREKGTNFFKF